MKTRGLVVTLAVLGIPWVVTGCKAKEPAGSTSQGSGSGAPAANAPPAARASQQPLPTMPAVEPSADPKHAEKVALGHALFFDSRLSGGNDRTCYSCHQNEDGNGGHDPIAIGSGNKPLTRHSPVIWNVRYYQNALYWDGRAKTLEENAKGAWGGGNMGAGADNLDNKAAEIAAIPGYKKLFATAFPGAVIKGDHVQQALAEYMRTLICNDTAYDKYASGDKTALSDAQQRGLDVFQGKAKCGICHAPPFFSTAMGLDNGIYFNAGIGTAGVPDDKVDVGRMKVSTLAADWAAFKPPSLRNVTRSAPYFHDGSVATLEDAVKLMAGGGIANKNKTPLLEDTKLSDGERADLIAFLGGLECSGKLDAPKLP